MPRDIDMRRWVRSWWADQMRNETVPDVPEDFEREEFFDIWKSEGRRIADRITKGRLRMTPVHPRQGEGVAEAVERVGKWANYLYTTPDQIAVRSPVSTFTAGDLRLILSALSSQAEALEAMAGALEAMRREFCNPMVRRALGGHNEAQMEAVLNARTALSTYRQTKEDTA